MLIIESIKLALGSIINNKLRSILTLLGIAVGLFSIIVVMTAISAIQQNVEVTFNSIGSNNFIIQKYPAIQVGGPHGSREFRNRKDLTIKEAENLIRLVELPAAIGINIGAGGKILKYQKEKTNPNVYVAGVNSGYLFALDLKLVEGRSLTKSDDELGRPVVILGYDVYSTLFKNIYPIGQTLKIDNYNFEVIGLLEKRGTVLGQSQDNFVCIPISIFQKYFGEKRSAVFFIMAKNKDMIEETKDEVIGALRKIRRVPPSSENDFEIITNDQLIAQFNDMTKYIKMSAGVIAFIAVVAAGIGIMNIMLVSVTERTREIGIRKAIGAKKKIILVQFVTEAIALSWFGGLIGILLGVIGGNIIAGILGFSVVMPVDWIVIGLSVTTLVGVIFGVYPAIKASNLDPIEALRYE